MAQHFHAARRWTYHYRDGAAHLDQWGQYLPFKMLGAPRLTEEAQDYDEGDTLLYWVIGNKHADIEEQREALLDHFSGSNCRHEHDCCGCASRYASVRHVGRGRFTVRITVTFNY